MLRGSESKLEFALCRPGRQLFDGHRQAGPAALRLHCAFADETAGPSAHELVGVFDRGLWQEAARRERDGDAGWRRARLHWSLLVAVQLARLLDSHRITPVLGGFS